MQELHNGALIEGFFHSHCLLYFGEFIFEGLDLELIGCMLLLKDLTKLFDTAGGFGVLTHDIQVKNIEALVGSVFRPLT